MMEPAGPRPMGQERSHVSEQRLAELAAAYGVATDFTDWTGTDTTIAPETLRAVLAALDIDASTPEAIDAALIAHDEAPWRRMLPPTTVIRADHGAELHVHVPAGQPVTVWVETETRRRIDLRQIDNWVPDREIDGAPIGEASFQLPGGLPLGYHRLHAETSGRVVDAATAHLIVTPGRVDLPEHLGDDRAWGLAAQLYSIRSEGSWGMGDLVDLQDLGVWSACSGADYLLVNPLHAAEPTTPIEPSPYLPTSRRFKNPLYLRCERIPEFADLPADRLDSIRMARTLLAADLDSTDEIRRDDIWPVKRAALRAIFDHGRSPGRELSFQAWIADQGQGLTDYAVWCVLTEVLGGGWRSWPEIFADPRSDAVSRFAADHEQDVRFHCWLQWCLDEQAETAQSAVRAAGMRLGIMHDLAVGVNPEGADAWALGDTYARGVTVGAPPDQFTRLGQDWSQPPLRPDRLAETGYAAFRDMVRAVLRHAGGVRVDHIIGLFRLWWVPAGRDPVDGTYVRYDHDAMLGILCLEAQRAGAIVVGEDLGTVEPWVRDVLLERGLLGTSILWFERNWDAGMPLPPGQWRTDCLASVTTHDLPPTAGYLAGEHVRLRHRLGLLDDLDAELAAAATERDQWVDVLHAEGLLPADVPADRAALTPSDLEEVVLALHRFVLATPARLVNIALPDLVGDPRTQNQPGTTDEYPNWRVPLADANGRLIQLEDVFTSERAARLLAEFPRH